MERAKWRQTQAREGRRLPPASPRCRVSIRPMVLVAGPSVSLLLRDRQLVLLQVPEPFHPPHATTGRPTRSTGLGLKSTCPPQLLRMERVWPHYFRIWWWETPGRIKASSPGHYPRAQTGAFAAPWPGWYALYPAAD